MIEQVEGDTRVRLLPREPLERGPQLSPCQSLPVELQVPAIVQSPAFFARRQLLGDPADAIAIQPVDTQVRLLLHTVVTRARASFESFRMSGIGVLHRFVVGGGDETRRRI